MHKVERGKFILRAVQPGSRRPILENYDRADDVSKRRAHLEQTGHSVIVLHGTDEAADERVLFRRDLPTKS